MEIVEHGYEIISLPDRLLETIEFCGRTCYKSENKITEGSAAKFVRMLIEKNHYAMIEFGDIIVKLTTNRGVTHEMVRHRLCSFAQESTRYVNYKSGEIQFIRPVWINKDWVANSINIIHKPLECYPEQMEERFAYNTWVNSCLRAEDDYKRLLNLGWRPEQAREVLPNSLKTEIVIKANIREMIHILDLRCNKAAHPQMRCLMLPLLAELHKRIPVLFDDLYSAY